MSIFVIPMQKDKTYQSSKIPLMRGVMNLDEWMMVDPHLQEDTTINTTSFLEIASVAGVDVFDNKTGFQQM